MNDTITVYRSQSPEYEQAFQTFLDHTDQKDAARAWLAPRVVRLPDKRLLVDAGAGEGKLTAWFCGEFARTIAIEPSEYLRAKLQKNCPGAEIVGGSILQAAVVDRAADLVLCSHVLYYIPVERWMEHAEKLAGWIADDGVLVVLLQNRHSDCSRMVAHFGGAQATCDLSPSSSNSSTAERTLRN